LFVFSNVTQFYDITLKNVVFIEMYTILFSNCVIINKATTTWIKKTFQ